MELSELKKIGLTSGEIKVYEALLDIGECTKTLLAKKSGISPSNIYDVTNRLIEKGIVSKVEKNGISHFSPANPNHLLHYVEGKEKAIQKEKEFAKNLLPMLLSRFNEKKESSNVEVFNGFEGLKTIFEDLIDECRKGDNCFVFGASAGENEKQYDLFFTKYSKVREQKGIITSIIFNEEVQKRKERIAFFKKSKAYNIRFLKQTTPAEIMLYKNKACILILSKTPLAIRITSKEVSDSFKQYFDVMWKEAKR